MALVLSVALLGASPAARPPEQPEPAQGEPPNVRHFNNEGGMVLNFIKSDKTAEFEEVMAALKQALAKSDKPERQKQAAGWKVFKSPDPAGANVLYVFVIDPAVPNVDYQVSNIIVEAFPTAEANVLLQKYADAYAQGMNIVNLNVVQDLGQP
jgi:hypothetical protein